MTQACLFCVSTKDTRTEAVEHVRDSVFEYLVGVEGHENRFPAGVGGGNGFYRASPTAGYVLNNRPYCDWDELQRDIKVPEYVVDHTIRFEVDRKLSGCRGAFDYDLDDDNTRADALESVVERVNGMPVDDDKLLLARCVNHVNLTQHPAQVIVDDVKEKYGETSGGNGKYRDGGAWYVESVPSFRDDLPDGRGDLYMYDCRGDVPAPVDSYSPYRTDNSAKKNRQAMRSFLDEVSDSAFVVHVGTKY